MRGEKRGERKKTQTERENETERQPRKQWMNVNEEEGNVGEETERTEEHR